VKTENDILRLIATAAEQPALRTVLKPFLAQAGKDIRAKTSLNCGQIDELFRVWAKLADDEKRKLLGVKGKKTPDFGMIFKKRMAAKVHRKLCRPTITNPPAKKLPKVVMTPELETELGLLSARDFRDRMANDALLAALIEKYGFEKFGREEAIDELHHVIESAASRTAMYTED
jgi:hypothetical protein